MKKWVKDLIADMPEVLIWDHEPGARAGDPYVFDWIHHQWRQDGQVFRTKAPGLAVKLTAHPVRHRKGHWQAPYCWVGLDHPVYMDKVGGVTSNRHRSPDPDVEHVTAEVTRDQEQANLEMADRQRRELALVKKPRDRRPWKQAA